MTAMLNIPSSVGLAFCLLILPFVFHVGRAGNKAMKYWPCSHCCQHVFISFLSQEASI